jgi:hypothetical protein
LNKLDKINIPGKIGSCAPDGGLWFYKNELIAVFEAKKQQNAGNAIERWFKNNFIVKKINPKCSYITFAIGAGAAENGVIYKTLHIAHYEGGINVYKPEMNSMFCSPTGFELSSIYSIMKNVLDERLNHVKK